MKSRAGKSPWLVYLPVVCLCLSTLVNSQIRGGGWQHLGSAHVDGRSDHDRIEVGGSGAFTALQMAVTNGAIGFERITVHFRNGGEEVLPVAAVVRSGGHTPPIPMRGGAREISNVEVWYAKGKFEGRPKVDLLGRR